MDSEALYKYSKLRQYRHGFTAAGGPRAVIVSEQVAMEAPTDDLGLISAIQGMEHCTCQNGTRLFRKPINSCDILYVYNGSAEVSSESGSFLLKKSDMLVADGTVSYTLQSVAQGKTELLLMSSFGVLSDHFCRLLCEKGFCRLHPRAEVLMEDLLQNLSLYARYPLRGNAALALSVLARVFSEAYLSTLNPESYTALGQPLWLQSALNYMEENYHRHLRIEQIAQQSGLSNSHFHRLFQQEMGLSPYGYLQKLRLDHAKTMLRSSDETVKYIAYSVGIPSVNHFIEYFRSETGITPAEYRRQSGT